MASMDDLISTLSDVHAGQKGNDLRDLRAKLTQTLQPSFPNIRPGPPPTNPYTIATHSSNGPMPPPAPVSSWNSPPPINNYLGGGAGAGGGGGMLGASPSYTSLGQGTSPRQGPYMAQHRETGFRPDMWGATASSSDKANKQAKDPLSANGPSLSATPGQMPPTVQQFGTPSDRRDPRPAGDAKVYRHADVLPTNPVPMDTGDFDDDPFAPLYTADAGRNPKSPARR